MIISHLWSSLTECSVGFIYVKSQFREKSGDFRLLWVLPGMRYCYSTLLSDLCSILYHVVDNKRLKTKENFRLLALKVAVVAYQRCSPTRDFKSNSDLTWTLLVFLKSGLVTRGGSTVLPFGFAPSVRYMSTHERSNESLDLHLVTSSIFIHSC